MSGWATFYDWFAPGPAPGDAMLHEVEGLENLNGTFVFEQDPAVCPPITWSKPISAGSITRIVDSQTSADFCTVVSNLTVFGGITWPGEGSPWVSGGIGASCGTALPSTDCSNVGLLGDCTLLAVGSSQTTSDPGSRDPFELVCTAPARTSTNAWYRERVIERWVNTMVFSSGFWSPGPDTKIGEYTEKVTVEFVT